MGPKESFYLRSPVSSPDNLREILSLAFGEAGRVRKQRTVFLVGTTRVHLDRVDGLGQFLELEVMLEQGEPVEQGVREAEELMARLRVESSNFGLARSGLPMEDHSYLPSMISSQ